MMPMISDDSDPSSSPRLRALKLLAMGVACMFAIGIVMMVSPVAGNVRVIGLITAVPVLMIAVSVVWLLRSRLSPTTAKGKRGLDGLDMYTMIDRMVDDLDDDEAAYLQRRLDQREGKAKHDLTASLEELLDQRAEDRQQRG